MEFGISRTINPVSVCPRHDHRMTGNGKRFYVLRLPLFHVVGTVRRRRCQTAPTEDVIGSRCRLEAVPCSRAVGGETGGLGAESPKKKSMKIKKTATSVAVGFEKDYLRHKCCLKQASSLDSGSHSPKKSSRNGDKSSSYSVPVQSL